MIGEADSTGFSGIPGESALTTRGLLHEAGRLATAHVGVVAGIWAGLVIVASLLDRLSLSGTGSTVPLAIATLVAEAGLVRLLLQAEGMIPATNARLPVISLLGANIATGAGILLGLIVLIIPGIYLLARWSIVAPVLIGENASVGAAIRASWNRTRRHALPIAVASVVVYLPALVAIVLSFLLGYNGLETGWLDLVSNALLYAGSVGGYVLAVATYRRLTPGQPVLHDIFA